MAAKVQSWARCAFRFDHDPETLEPRGRECGRPTVELLRWCDGRVSPACKRHGAKALTQEARALLVRVERFSSPGVR